MALNYSHRPIFPALVSDDQLVPPMRIVNGYLVECAPVKIAEGFDWPVLASCEPEVWVGCEKERESASLDMVGLLPLDPFEIALRNTVTALSDWLNDFEFDSGGFHKVSVDPIKEDYSFLPGLDLIWNSAIRFQQSPSNNQSHCMKLNVSSSMSPSLKEATRDASVPIFGTTSTFRTRDTAGFKNDFTNDFLARIEVDNSLCSSGGNGEAPHEGFFYALGYLGVKDLLSLQMASKLLCSTVRDDPLLWRSIHIDKPLNERITDDVLQRLCSKALGNVRCLSLIQCTRITDDCLRLVLEANPSMTKLCVPGCTRLSIDGILNILKDFNSKRGSRIRHLKIGGLYGATHEHYERLKSLLGAEFPNKQNNQKPHFYLRGSFYRLCDDDRPIDIEPCPRCEKIRMVYDCPSQGCQVKDHSTQVCRACTLCIPRCVHCGKCINDGPYEETFCLENLCTDCHDWMENQEEGVALPG